MYAFSRHSRQEEGGCEGSWRTEAENVNKGNGTDGAQRV